MPSIAAVDRRCFLARARVVNERCFLAGRVPLGPIAIRGPLPPKPAEREAAPTPA